MSRAERVFSAEFRSGLRAELTVSMSRVNCEWTPDVPDLTRRSGRKLLATYRIWRDDCLRTFAEEHGLVLKKLNVCGFDVLALCESGGRA